MSSPLVCGAHREGGVCELQAVYSEKRVQFVCIQFVCIKQEKTLSKKRLDNRLYYVRFWIDIRVSET